MRSEKLKTMCRVAIVAALYVALTTLNPISWGTVQFRIATMLCVLPFYDKKYSPAILLGVGIANAFSPLGVVDVAAGLLAHGSCHALFVFGPGRKLPLVAKTVALAVLVALIVGAELTVVYQIPFALNVASLFISTLIILLMGLVIFKPLHSREIV